MDHSSSFLWMIAWWIALSTSRFLQETLYDFLVLFSLCNETTTVKTVLSEVKASEWSPCFSARNFCSTGSYSRCSLLIPSIPFRKMILKFDKHGSPQIGQISRLSIIDYYYIFTIYLSLLIPDRIMKAPFACKIQSSWKLRNSVNE